MAPSSSIAIIPLFLILAVVGAGVVVAILLFRRRRLGEQEPVCGKCGYLVKGLTTFTCPECGSDLREVGIVTSGMRTPLSPLARAIIWTIVLPLPALLLSGLIVVLVPPIHKVTETRAYKPSSGAYPEITLTSTGKGPQYGSVPVQRLTFQLKPNPGTASPANAGELIVDPANLGYQYLRRDGQIVKEPSGLDADVILAWMATAGIQKDSAIQTQAGELLREASTFRFGTAGAPMSSLTCTRQSTSMQSSPPLWLTVALLTFWPAVWLLGLGRILHRKPTPSPAPE